VLSRVWSNRLRTHNSPGWSPRWPVNRLRSQGRSQISVSVYKRNSAGRRRSIREAFGKESAWQWRSSRRQLNVKAGSLQEGEMWNRGHPAHRIPIQVLSHRLRRIRVQAGAAGDGEVKNAGRQTEAKRENDDQYQQVAPRTAWTQCRTATSCNGHWGTPVRQPRGII
jgi:hypothetical protein